MPVRAAQAAASTALLGAGKQTDAKAPPSLPPSLPRAETMRPNAVHFAAPQMQPPAANPHHPRRA